MATATRPPKDIDAYIAGFPPDVQTILKKIRATVASAAPDADERISYRMPAFAQDGILIWFAAFKAHIGVFPPVSGDPKLEKALAPYAGPKGNLRFPFDEPIPYPLIRRIVQHKLQQNRAETSASRPKTRSRRMNSTR
jgi:uncharacterized protein YdhG (YjbR/CyaY superfamily)